LLGPFAVTIDGAPVTAFEYAKVRALLAYLAVESHRPHTRAELAALFWPDQPERTARASLSQALTTLRSALGDKTAERPVLLSDALAVRLDPQSVGDVDVRQFFALLSECDAHAHHSWRVCAQCAERLRRAVQLYRGHLLGDIAIADSAAFEEWATMQREHARQRALGALERLVERAQWRGDYGEAIAYAQRQVELEPLLEAPQRILMRLLAANGEGSAALARYWQTQTLLAHELGAEPEEATTALFNQIRAGESVSSPPQAPFVVPALPTPLVGRAEELRAICARLRDQKARAVTITGTGGIGKTRLAIEAAHALRYDFEDGVYVVELAALSDPALVVDAIAQALGVKERPAQGFSDTLRAYLRTKHMLLVLDNFEHVVEAAPRVSELLAGCPSLTVLVTSRTPLAIRAEQQLALEPLPEADAVQLFVQRARAVGAAWAADEADTATYAAICRQLDRLPLAIELIAVRTRTLSAAELLRQLDRPLQVLVRGPRDVPARHQALRNAIQWSYDLLDAGAQRAFATLGVFAGGWGAEAAQAVLGEECEALPVLEALHGASLVQQHMALGQTRFSMLETIREFALEQLQGQAAAEAAHHRHAEHFASFSMAAYLELLRADAPRWRAWVAAEQDNLRVAFRWALEHQAHATALRLATGVWRFHYMSGSLREGLQHLETALEYRGQAPLELQSNALRAAGTLAIGLNDYARARRWLEAAVQAGWSLGDRNALQPVLTNLGFAALEQGELEDALVHLEVALSLAQRSNDPTIAKFPLGMLARLHLRLGNYAQARELGEECLRINQAREDPEGTANALRGLGEIINAQGEALRARQLGEEALALHRSLNHQLGMGLDHALLGDVARAQGDYDEALAQYQQCLDLWRDRENAANCAMVLDSIAQVICLKGDYARSAALLGAAAAIRRRASVRLAAAEQAACDEAMRACRAALGVAAFADAWAHGGGLALAQAVALASEPLAGMPAAGLARRGPRPSTRDNPMGLTRREAEVLTLLAEGLTNAQIGAQLSITPKTADHHVAAILSKLGAHTRGEAVAIALRSNVAA
jgi:predicted ATPase/DNA-binding SARP family transcriptional activator/DNA-binding NarL/FixJ family response regulator